LHKVPHTDARPTFLRSLLIVAGVLSLVALRTSPAPPVKPRETVPPRHEPLARQLVRAHQPGRGREATSPLGIPWKGWKDIFLRTVAQVSEHRLTAISAGVVFFALLGLFPAITALVSAYGLFAPPATIHDHLSFAAELMPASAYAIVGDQIARVVAKSDATLGLGFFFGFGFALWSANAGMKAIIDALNVVYDETEKRGLIRLNLMSLAMTAGAIVAVLSAVGVVVVTPPLLERIGFGASTGSIVRIVRWPALVLGMSAGLAILYRYGPSRREAKWEWLSVGTVVATLAWFGGSAALSYYLANFANYDATYGSLGAAIGTMTWMWMSAIVVLFGAALNSEIEHQTARDTTIGAEKPLGARGATMADTVEPAQAT